MPSGGVLIHRYNGALPGIKPVAPTAPLLAAEGTVASRENYRSCWRIDSLFGALGAPAKKTIGTLILIIAKTDVDKNTRKLW